MVDQEVADENALPVDKTEVLALFPTFVWRIELKPEDSEVINQKIKQKLDELTAGKLNLEPGEKWQTEQNLHKLDEFQKLNSFVYTAARSIFDFMKIDYDDVLITGCWANISAIRTRHQAHTHPNNFLSGVYYVQAEKGADSITVDDPRPQVATIAPPTRMNTPENARKMHLSVKAGTLLMFPSWLPHSVQANMSGQQRISVAYNLMFTSFGEKMATPQWEGNVEVT
ncbi:MAG: hypothetical protein BMS9Abin10_0103 [Gammaproteobacteria bacterium]|nr:MAG: hypothetical protein BMS9Abin10_0103 [Gammaproteobacteria bacterium]